MSTKESLCKRSRDVLEASWVADPGYTCPNSKQYPWQWLWDSCFHSIAWSALGDERAVTELESLFSTLTPRGFLPNQIYHNRPWAGSWMWWRRGHSTITQPPMYGHALHVLHERGFAVEHLLESATNALNYLIDSRLDAATGLVRIFHPWESGCDDSPRWDSWMPSGYYRTVWNLNKFLLVRSMKVRGKGAVASQRFEVCASSFNALVAYNALQLADLTGDKQLLEKGRSIAKVLELAWDADKRTWSDLLPVTGAVSSSVPTHEAFLPLLVVQNQEQREAAWQHLTDPQAFLRPFGIAGVSISEPSYGADKYWRGGCWPQVCYLLWQAAVEQERPEQAIIEPLIINGIARSDLAEYWNPETGAACGAQPQSWSAVVLQMLR